MGSNSIGIPFLTATMHTTSDFSLEAPSSAAWNPPPLPSAAWNPLIAWPPLQLAAQHPPLAQPPLRKIVIQHLQTNPLWDNW